MPGGQSIRIESYYPGRIRLRLPRHRRTSEAVSDITSLLDGLGGIHGVESNLKSGGILIRYDPELVDIERLMRLGRAAGYVAEAAVDLIEGVEAAGWLNPTPAATRMVRGLKRFDRSVFWMTKGHLDAKVLVPIALLALSLGRAFAKDCPSPTPWHSLMWYGYSVFMQWNRPNRASGPARASL